MEPSVVLFLSFQVFLWHINLDGRLFSTYLRSVPPSAVRLEKLTVPHVHINSTYFMEHESSLAHSQQPATCSYPYTHQSNPRQLTLGLTCILILPPHLRERLVSELSPAPSTRNSHTCQSAPSAVQQEHQYTFASPPSVLFHCRPRPSSQLHSPAF